MSASATYRPWVPQHSRDITIGRIGSYLSQDLFSDANLMSKQCKSVSSESVQLQVYSVPKDQPNPKYDDVIKQAFAPAKVGDSFGPSWTTHWFRVRAVVPDTWQGEGPLKFVWDSGSEAMVWVDGQPVQGLTDSRNEYHLADVLTPSASFELYVEMACNTLGGNSDGIGPTNENRYYTIKQAGLMVPNMDIRQLIYDLRVLQDLAKTLPPDSALGNDALFSANQVINAINLDDPATFMEARLIAARFFARRSSQQRIQVLACGHCHIDTAWLWPFSETRRKAARSWVSQLALMKEWPEHQFCASSAQQYQWVLEDYPGLFSRIQDAAAAGRFIPVGGCWVEMDTNVPSGESLVRQMLQGQRFFEQHFGQRCEVFWLPDTFGYAAQLPQLMSQAGMKYFLTQKLSWNNINPFPHNSFIWQALDGTGVLTHFPPSNTYGATVSAADMLNSVTNNKDKDRAPASMLLFGYGDGGGGPTAEMIENFTRLGDLEGLASARLDSPNKFFHHLEACSHDLLTWKGELYFELHRGTYTSHAKNKWFNRKCEGLLREVELLAALMVAVAEVSPSLYPCAELQQLWRDLLLFQFHDVLPGSAIQRVYDTSLKRYAEMLPALQAMRSGALGALARGLKKHPPTSTPTSTSAQTQSAAAPPVPTRPAAATASRSASSSSSALQMSPLPMPGLSHQDSTGGGGGGGGSVVSHGAVMSHGAVFFNSLAVFRREVVEVPVSAMTNVKAGVQVTGDGDSTLAVVSAPPLSFKAASAVELPPDKGVQVIIKCFSGTSYILDNLFVSAEFDSSGRLVQLKDKVADRLLVPEGALGNRFLYFEDIPLFWDAWDVEVYHLEKNWEAGAGQVELLEKGPLRAVLRVTCQLSPTSSLVQTISMTALSPRIDFDCTVQWNENRKMLKVEFPWQLAADNATYEVQYGAVQRPTHQNTSWDWAKFEVCHHRWMDLSEPDYGVALLNDSKYGASCHGGTMRLSLLRSPKAPDATTDMDTHRFCFSVFPHQGSWQAAGVVAEAAALNTPLLALPAPSGGEEGPGLKAISGGLRSVLGTPLMEVVPPGGNPPAGPPKPPPLMLDTIKLAEPLINPTPASQHQAAANDTDDDLGVWMVVRLYEPHGCRGRARLQWPAWLRVDRVMRVNLLEDELGEVAAGADLSGVMIDFTPFQVISLKLHVTQEEDYVAVRRGIDSDDDSLDIEFQQCAVS